VDREVTVVIPAAGRSSRFPDHKPKWLLTQPNGCLMVVDALGALNMAKVACVVVGILRDHLDRFCGGDAKALLKAFEDGHPDLQQIPISIVVIPVETVDQVQTLECIVDAAGITGPIFVKDCDNQFACPVNAIDGVATQEITGSIQSISIPAAKSYVSLTTNGLITNIAEKVILGNTFCIGGYSFRSASSTIASVATARRYQKLTSSTDVELSVSDIVWVKMLMEHTTFVSIPASSYEDWGTVDTWEAYTRTWKTLFVDIDGTLFKNTGQYFTPSWSEGSGSVLLRNVEYLRSLHARGRTQIVLTTTRPEVFRNVTERQLKEGGVPFNRICFGLFHCQRVLINDWAKTNPFPSAVAVSLRRDGEDLRELLTY
jgi:choline kinase